VFFIITVAASGVFYAQLPDSMATHWNSAGVPDGFSPRHIGVLIGPIMLLILYFFMAIIPHIDPLSENIGHFRRYYDTFWIVLAAFFSYVHGLTIVANLGVQFNMGRALLPAIAGLWYFIGMLLKYAEPNWFVGIRTPWTLSDPRVWLSTHRIGSVLFKIGAVCMLVSVLRPTYGYMVVLVAATGSSLFLVVYSYFAYRRLHIK
jgi:uncharacterized membrane protein